MKKRAFATILAFLLIGSACDLGTIVPTESSSVETSSSSSSSDSAEDRCNHVDVANDGYCDECTENVVITLDFYSINDLHGKFADTDTQPGVDELTSYLKEKKQSENAIFLSSGDMWQGSSESNLTKGAIITEWMNELGFSSMAIGNHEYDWGESYIEANAELAEFPFLALNIYDRDTNALAEYCQPSIMIERGGAKIGIIGAIGDCYSSIAQDKAEDVYFKTGSQLTSLVKAEAQALRAQGADFIVYSLHDGEGGYDETLSNGYVDLVFEGHSHQRYVETDSYGVYHLQGGGDNDGITHAEVKLNYANGNAETLEAEFLSTSVYAHSYDGDLIVDELLKKYERQIEMGDKELGYNDFYRDNDDICDLVAQLYYETGLETWGEQYDIVLGGAFLQTRSPYELASGAVTYADLMSILPFDNQIVLCSISGAKLRSQFFETTNNRYHIYYEEYGLSVYLRIDASETYYIVTDTYTSTYAYNGLTEVARLDETTFARDLLADYIQAGGLTSGTTEIEYTSFDEIYEIGESLADNEETKEMYYVKGTIQSIASNYYGNMVLVDEDGNTLYIYGVKDKTGSTFYGNLTNPPQVGDEVVLLGTVKRYVYDGTVTIEIMNGKIQDVQ